MADTSDTELLAERAPRKRPARPLLHAYLSAYGIYLRTAAKEIGDVSHEQVRRFCLPFDDPKRAEPDADLARRIALWTHGAVAPWTFEDTPGARAIGLAGLPVTVTGEAP